MADSINRTSFVLNKSCSTVTCPESHWLKIDRATHNAMAAVPVEYRIIDGDPEQPREMTQLEKDAVDAATLPAVRAARIAAMGAEMANIVRGVDQAGREFNHGPLQQFSIFAEDAVLILTTMAAGYFLLLVLERGGLVGKGRFLSRLVRERLYAEFV